jgi:thiol-disulfide isomerase/thioredoxin
MRPLLIAATFAASLLLCATATDARQTEKKTDPKAGKADPDKKFNMKVKAGDIRLGKHVSGPKYTADDFNGKVVMVDYWGVNCVPCLAAMPATAAMNAELDDFGLVVIGSHVQSATPDKIRAVAASRGANFAITEQTRVAGGDDFEGIPHVMVFDHTGACVFRGGPKEAEHAARLAVGEMLVAGAGREKFSQAVAPVVADLKKGRPPASVLARLASIQQSAGKGEPAAEAKALVGSITATGRKKLEQAQAKVESEPFEAFLLVENLPATYKGTPVAKEATAMITKLKKDKSVANEIAARPSLEAVRQLAGQLAAKPGADEAGVAAFQKANAALLQQLRTKTAQMKKNWPDAKATAEAAEIAETYAPAK